VVKLSRPGHTVFDKVGDMIARVLGDSFKLQRRDYW
jgi:hypothetical protein